VGVPGGSTGSAEVAIASALICRCRRACGLAAMTFVAVGAAAVDPDSVCIDHPTPNPLSRADASALIGVLSTLEGELLARSDNDLWNGLASRLRGDGVCRPRRVIELVYGSRWRASTSVCGMRSANTKTSPSPTTDSLITMCGSAPRPRPLPSSGPWRGLGCRPHRTQPKTATPNHSSSWWRLASQSSARASNAEKNRSVWPHSRLAGSTRVGVGPRLRRRPERRCHPSAIAAVPATPTHAPPCATTEHATTSTATPTTSLPPTWPPEPNAPSCR
jgi:hypothetical protein